jgi:hypothetical protein
MSTLYVVCTGEKRCSVRICEGKILVGRCGHRWEDGMKMDRKEIEWENKKWKT